MGPKPKIRVWFQLIISLILLAAGSTAAVLVLGSLMQPWGTTIVAEQLRWLIGSLPLALGISIGIGIGIMLLIRKSQE